MSVSLLFHKLSRDIDCKSKYVQRCHCHIADCLTLLVKCMNYTHSQAINSVKREVKGCKSTSRIATRLVVAAQSNGIVGVN